MPNKMYRNAGLHAVEPVEVDDNALKENPHFSIRFLEYLLAEIIPYQCLLDSSLLNLLNLTDTHLTNSASESWSDVNQFENLISAKTL